MRLENIFRQLKQRRVIRAAIIYLAVLWAILQAADLFAGAGVLRPATVRWLIVAGIVGLPVVLIASWFLESPWRDRRAAAIAGDVLVIVAIAVAALLLAWQQWFVSFTRPAVAVLPIPATDTSRTTEDIADHIGRRLRDALATRPEMRVVELDSSRLPAIAGLGVTGQSRLLGTDYLLTGTLSRSDRMLRLSLQLFDGNGDLLWSERFDDRLIDLQQLLVRVTTAIWPVLPVDSGALSRVNAELTACEYPARIDAVIALARSENRNLPLAELAEHIDANEDDGLLYIEQARRRFESLDALPAAERPVAYRLAMRALEIAEDQCPGHPAVGLWRLVNTGRVIGDKGDSGRFAASYPNSAAIYRLLAERERAHGEADAALALMREAVLLDPLGRKTLCAARELQAAADGDEALAESSDRLTRYHPGGCDLSAAPTKSIPHR